MTIPMLLAACAMHKAPAPVAATDEAPTKAKAEEPAAPSNEPVAEATLGTTPPATASAPPTPAIPAPAATEAAAAPPPPPAAVAHAPKRDVAAFKDTPADDLARAVAGPVAGAPLGGLAGPGTGAGAGAGRGVELAARTSALAFAASSAGPIAAGEWDDNANYREFSKWLGTEASAHTFPRVDVSHRRFLVVRDAEGRAVPGCSVVVDGDQRSVTLTTGPSGRALLFPRAEGFRGDVVTASARCDDATVTREVSLADSDGAVDLRLPTLRALPDDRTIDVAFILDTTGSMSEEIASVKSTIAKVAQGLGDANVHVRIGLVEFKDRGDPYVTRVYPFSNDAQTFAARVSGLSASGGGDTPESVNEGVHVALTQLDWKASSVGRFAFLVGDAPPHLDYQQDYSYAVDMKSAAHRGIQIFTIAASGMDEVGQVVWRQIAQYTNGANMFVLRGGAGPQSVGGGDPKNSCGGTHANYSSGHLDELILAKIHRELHALDGDPMRIAGLREDEDAKPCDQRIVMQ